MKGHTGGQTTNQQTNLILNVRIPDGKLPSCLIYAFAATARRFKLERTPAWVCGRCTIALMMAMVADSAYSARPRSITCKVSGGVES